MTKPKTGLLDTEWQVFQTEMIRPHLPEAAKDMLRVAFYAGAVQTVALVALIVRESEEDLPSLLMHINAEALEYAAERCRHEGCNCCDHERTTTHDHHHHD